MKPYSEPSPFFGIGTCAEESEKQYQISMLANLKEANKDATAQALAKIQKAAIQNDNIFEELMDAAKICSLGQITEALFEVGGQYRRNM